jgi:hypothetical protein
VAVVTLRRGGPLLGRFEAHRLRELGLLAQVLELERLQYGVEDGAKKGFAAVDALLAKLAAQ